MPTKLKRISVNVTPEVEKALDELRKNEPYKSMSLSEIMLSYAAKGLEITKNDNPN